MLKTLTLSLSFAAALAMSNVSKAGGWFDKDDDVKPVGLGFGSAQTSPQYASPQKCLPTPQCPDPVKKCLPTPQCPDPVKKCLPTPQCPKPSSQCLPSPQGVLSKFHNPLPSICGKMKSAMSGICLPKPTITYEWVLKKKICWTKTSVFPSSQCSPQSSPQGYAASSSQASTYGSTQAPATTDTAAPAAPAATVEAPKGPDVAPPPPAAGAASAEPTPAPPAAPTTGLLFSRPVGY